MGRIMFWVTILYILNFSIIEIPMAFQQYANYEEWNSPPLMKGDKIPEIYNFRQSVTLAESKPMGCHSLWAGRVCADIGYQFTIFMNQNPQI
jgi:hypothetical protein